MMSARRNQIQVRRRESGNAFLIILLGIVLFAALGFSVARSMRGSVSESMSARDAELAAADILNYAQAVERAVNRVRNKGVSENNISFENPVVTGYEHTPAAPDTAQVFNPAGGNAQWKDAPPGANDGSPWHYTGSSCIPDLGTGTAGCESDGISNEELIAALYHLKMDVCERINTKLGITGIPVNGGADGPSPQKFTGPLQGDTALDFGSVLNAGCIQADADSNGQPDYFFFYVLIPR